MKKNLHIFLCLLLLLTYVEIPVFTEPKTQGCNEVDKLSQHIEYQCNRIDSLNRRIYDLEQIKESSLISLYNERAIAYFLLGKFDLALNDFNRVLKEHQYSDSTQDSELGTALWGCLFCHAFQNQIDETYYDSEIIQTYFVCSSCLEGSTQQSNDFNLLKGHYYNAVFANPEEKITVWQCHDRMKRLAGKAQAIADRIPGIVVKEIVTLTLKKLENMGHNCCEQKKQWTICLGPIADAWQVLEELEDQIVDLFNRGFNIPHLLGAGGIN